MLSHPNLENNPEKKGIFLNNCEQLYVLSLVNGINMGDVMHQFELLKTCGLET